MIDFIERLKEFTEGLSYTPSTIEIGLYNENQNSIAIRPTPSSINDRYMEKGKIYPYNFQVLVHMDGSNNLLAYQTIEKLVSEYENLSRGAITSNDGSFNLVTIQCSTTPNLVQKTSFGVLYTAIFNAELYIKGGNE